MVNSLNILFTSSGRRVSLINKFKDVYEEYNIEGKIITADVKQNAPTAFISDKHYILPSINHENYLTELLSLCIRENISLIIPLIDTELPLFAFNKQIFSEYGVKLLVSGMELNEIAGDKNKTYNFFVSNNISTPKVYSKEELRRNEYNFPLLLKPYDGSSSKGVTLITNEEELNFFKSYIPNAMVQEFITGEEYTVDVMVDFGGNVKTIVPRLRLETRAGEVSKGITRKDITIINAVKGVVKALPDPVGCITIQCIKKENGDIKFIEINPRFGGGIPLTIEAGANFPLWVIEMSQGKVFTDQYFGWKDNITMLRYDEAIFTEKILQ
ncbi:ATP-grasp domain-containing protein [Oceanobacillus chungangensis]|nr:ATP-grasp domain-containing protein [Oceanobacillus chungangensis]